MATIQANKVKVDFTMNPADYEILQQIKRRDGYVSDSETMRAIIRASKPKESKILVGENNSVT